MRNVVLSGFLIAVSCASSVAQENKISVSVEQSGNDEIGKEIAFEVSERLSASGQFKLIDDVERGYHIRLASLGTDFSMQGMSVYEVVITQAALPFDPNPQKLHPYYLASTVGYCGKKSPRECADKAYMAAAQVIIADRNSWQDTVNSLRKHN